MRRLLAAMSSVAILTTACGGGASPIAAPTMSAAATTTLATPQGTNASPQGDNAGGAPDVFGGNAEVPAGFPMPVPDWAEVASVMQDDSRGSASYTIQLIVDTSRKDEAMDIYRAYYSDQGLTIDDAGDFLSGQNADVFSAVVATESSDITLVILSWGPS